MSVHIGCRLPPVSLWFLWSPWWPARLCDSPTGSVYGLSLPLVLCFVQEHDESPESGLELEISLILMIPCLWYIWLQVCGSLVIKSWDITDQNDGQLIYSFFAYSLVVYVIFYDWIATVLQLTVIFMSNKMFVLTILL